MNQALGELPHMLRRWWRLPAALVLVVVIVTAMNYSKHDVVEAAPIRDAGSERSVLLIGDSYTAGPTTPDLSYGCITADRLGWRCDVAAEGGTGYLNGGPGHRLPVIADSAPSTSIVERLPRLREMYHPDIIILDGGRNDLQFDMAHLCKTLTSTVTQVRAAWPAGRIVVIAPWFLNEPVIRPSGTSGHTVGEVFRMALGSSTDLAGVDVVDPGALGWFADGDIAQFVSDDGIHPTGKGVERIADLLTTALVSDGIAGPS